MGMTKDRFAALWNRCVADGAVAKSAPLYEELWRRYSEPHRRYHTPDHISHCLQQLDLAAKLMDDPDAVEMGLWFHDVIYNPRATDNELKSAQLFAELVNDHIDPDFRQSVFDLILITTHPEQPARLDEKFIVDIDLSSFALPWDHFQQDSDAVRQEYAHISDEKFFPNHLQFLRALVDRPTFFFTDFFRGRYETTARENVARYMADLGKQGFS
ncbi:MAG: hypothetical protein ACE5K1_05200 [Acidiferrobacterales bacterium]